MRVFWTLLVFAALVIAQEDKECTVSDSQGNWYDLSPLTRTSGDDWVVETPNAVYRLNICKSILHEQTGIMHPEDAAGVVKGHQDTKAYNIGKPNYKPVYQDGLQLRYTNGDSCHKDIDQKRQISITFFCDKAVSGHGDPEFVTEFEDCEYAFVWRTPLACPGEYSRGGLSGGDVFGILIGVGFGIYFIGGILFNRFVRNVGGLQQIPHYDFWFNVFDWLKDMIIIVYSMAFSMCRKPRPRNMYTGLSLDAENTLIDGFEDDEYDEH